MKHYYGFKSTSGDMETFQLLPLTKEAIFVEGKYFPGSKVLVLLHPDTKEVFDLVEKFTPEGTFEISTRTGKAKVERVRIQSNYNYQLAGEDVTWFINTYVENSEQVLNIIKGTIIITNPEPIEVE